MGKYLTLYIVTAVVFIAADFIWLGFVAKGFYQESLGHLMLEKPNLVVAIIFYLLYPIGLVVFASAGGYASESWLQTIGYAALFGFLAYCTYDLSNLATLKGIPTSFAIVDIVWGTVVSAVSSVAAVAVARAIS